MELGKCSEAYNEAGIYTRMRYNIGIQHQEDRMKEFTIFNIYIYIYNS